MKGPKRVPPQLNFFFSCGYGNTWSAISCRILIEPWPVAHIASRHMADAITNPIENMKERKIKKSSSHSYSFSLLYAVYYSRSIRRSIVVRAYFSFFLNPLNDCFVWQVKASRGFWSRMPQTVCSHEKLAPLAGSSDADCWNGKERSR